MTLEQHESKTSDYTLTFVDDGNVVLTLDAEKARRRQCCCAPVLLLLCDCVAALPCASFLLRLSISPHIIPAYPPTHPQCGNEGRFVNDFRGTGKKANVKFQERVDERGCTHMGIYVGGSPIAKGEEARVGVIIA